MSVPLGGWLCGRCGERVPRGTVHELDVCRGRVHCMQAGHSWVPHQNDDGVFLCVSCSAESDSPD